MRSFGSPLFDQQTFSASLTRSRSGLQGSAAKPHAGLVINHFPNNQITVKYSFAAFFEETEGLLRHPVLQCASENRISRIPTQSQSTNGQMYGCGSTKGLEEGY